MLNIFIFNVLGFIEISKEWLMLLILLFFKFIFVSIWKLLLGNGLIIDNCFFVCCIKKGFVDWLLICYLFMYVFYFCFKIGLESL